MDDFTKKISDFAEKFVSDKNKRANNKLDFSVESLTAVDELLEEVHEFSCDLDDIVIENLSNEIGFYIFEVARRNFGGTYYWYDKLNQPILVTGQPEYEVSLLAVEKVKGRIINGIEDSIPFFFDGYIRAVERGRSEKGYRSMIV